ncbi:MAG: hypothetical protein IPP90_20690 [Gemmatimonadaceae bacterium]|nr:hypothetical protein [Gemmatimonadaceae bacterium]
MKRWSEGELALAIGALAMVVSGHPASAQQSTGVDTVRRQASPLAPVVTKAEALASKLDDVGFTYRRIHSGAPPSQFLTRLEIEKRAVTDLSQLLRRMKGRAWGCGDGVLFIDGVLQATPIPGKEADTARYVPLESRGKGAPPVAAAPMPKANPLDQIAINTVDAIEVYSGPSEIPLEFKAAFRQARCVVAVWTR